MNKKLVSALLVFGIMGFSNFTLAEERALTGGEVAAMFSEKPYGEKMQKKDDYIFFSRWKFQWEES